MTPEEQDKELREKLTKLISQDGWVDIYEVDVDGQVNDLFAIITTDRKRVALEARIDELDRTMPHTDGMRHYNTVKRRIAELKAQEEEL